MEDHQIRSAPWASIHRYRKRRVKLTECTVTLYRAEEEGAYGFLFFLRRKGVDYFVCWKYVRLYVQFYDLPTFMTIIYVYRVNFIFQKFNFLELNAGFLAI